MSRVQINNTGAVINQLQQGENYVPFGVNDEDVQIYIKIQDGDNISYQEWGSLRDFFEEWINFKNTWNDFITNADFIKVSNDLSENNHVKLWFKTKDTSS